MPATTRKKKRSPSPPPAKPAGKRAAPKKPGAARAGGVRLFKTEIACPLTTLGEASAVAKTSVINDSGAAIEIERIVDETGMFPEELELYGFAENTTVAPGGRLVLDFAYRPKRAGTYETRLQIHLTSGEVLELTVKGTAQKLWKSPATDDGGWTGSPEGAGKLGFSGPGGARHLSFGRVPVGTSSRRRPVTVKNLGTQPLSLVGFAADEELSVTVRGPVETPTLEPGASVVADVIYTPKEPGMHVSHLFGLTSFGRPKGHIEVHGRATRPAPSRKRPARPPKRETSTSAKKAPSKPVLSSAIDELDITSTAGGAIGSAAFVLRVDRGEGPIYFHARDGFSVREPRNGASVKAGQTLRVEVRYTARSVGTKQSRLVIEPSFGPSLVVRLRGHGRKVDMNARTPKARVPVLPRPPEPTGDGEKEVTTTDPEKDKTKDKGTAKAVDIELITDREKYDASVWSIDKLAERVVDGCIAVVNNLETALDAFKEVVARPSKNEANRRGVLEVGVRDAQKLLVKLILGPALKAVPVVGSGLYEALKAGLTIADEVDKDGKRSAREKTSNALKDFLVGQIENLGAVRNQLRTSRAEMAMKAENASSRMASESDRKAFKDQLFQWGSRIRQRAAGELSEGALFTHLTRSWTVDSPRVGTQANRLLIRLDREWNLITGVLIAPYGDRLAEELLRKHGGSLDVVQLGVPIEVSWMPFSNEPGGNTVYCGAWLAADGTLERIRVSGLVANPKALIARMEQLLVERGVPEVTKLRGTTS